MSEGAKTHEAGNGKVQRAGGRQAQRAQNRVQSSS